jgi:hypothetical protein
MAEAVAAEQPRIMDFVRFQLWTPTPGAEGKRARLAFGIRDGNPRVTVFTNDPNDKVDKGVIFAGIDPETFFAFLMDFERIVRQNKEDKNKLDCYRSRWENDKPTSDRILGSTLRYGKDADGIVWICLEADNRPKIRFNFKLSEWHAFVKSDGNHISEAEGSVYSALAKIALLRTCYGEAIAKTAATTPAGRQNSGKKDDFKKSGGNDMFGASDGLF